MLVRLLNASPSVRSQRKLHWSNTRSEGVLCYRMASSFIPNNHVTFPKTCSNTLTLRIINTLKQKGWHDRREIRFLLVPCLKRLLVRRPYTSSSFKEKYSVVTSGYFCNMNSEELIVVMSTLSNCWSQCAQDWLYLKSKPT